MPFKSIALTGLLLFIFTTPVRCEYYQYVDQKGVKHFTDNISQIPEDQRKNLNIYQSIKSPEKEPAAEPDNKMTAESLTIQRAELDKKYNDLIAKKQKLEDQKKEINETRYNELVNELNREIRQYQIENDTYKDLVIQFNNKVTLKQNAPPEPDSKNISTEGTQPPEEPAEYEAPEEQTE